MAQRNIEDYASQNGENYAAIPMNVLAGGITDVLYCPWSRDLIIQILVAGLASGESVSGRVEGNLDNGDDFDNMAADGLDTTITEDGITLLNYDGAVPPYVRASGFSVGSGITVTVKAFFGVMS